MIVLSEATPSLPDAPSKADLLRSTEAARLQDWQVFEISQEGPAHERLWHVPHQLHPAPAVWVGFIPSWETYQSFHAECQNKNLQLLNDPAQHRRVLELDCQRLAALTPETVTVSSLEELEETLPVLSLPVFVRGAVQSRKARGWQACVAADSNELRALVKIHLDLEQRSRGKVLLRRLLRLRHDECSAQGFPFGREYRVFLLNQTVLGWTYYWDRPDKLAHLDETEYAEVIGLALETQRRLEVPFLSVDIGQDEKLRWWVIETGDAQFSGLSRLSPLKFWLNLKSAIEVQPIS